MADIKKQIIKMMESEKIVKYGYFKLSSGKYSDHYFNIKKIISCPKLCELLAKYIKCEDFTTICGVPEGAITMAAIFAVLLGKKSIQVRKKAKTYGLHELIMGELAEKDTVLVVEDVCTTGASVFEFVEKLVRRKVKISKVICVMDRMSFDNRKKLIEKLNKYSIPFVALLAERDFTLQKIKKSTKDKPNICLSADLPTTKEILDMSEKLGDNLCAVKIHSDIYPYDPDFIVELKNISRKKNFLIIEDRKLIDFSSIILRQLEGTWEIAEWADAITVHQSVGKAALKAIIDKYNIKILLIMSNKDTSIVEGIESYILGFISDDKVPHKSILTWSSKTNCDYIILSNEICKASNPLAKLKEYL